MARSLKNGFIKLDSFCKTYYSGQVILGSVVFELNSPLTFSVLNIEFIGEAKVTLPKELPEDEDSPSLVKYEGHEEYFKVTQCLAGGTGVSQVPAGTQEFPFTFQIPHTAPSSFGDDVTYRITAYLYCANPNVPRNEITQRFEVVAPFDLNLGGRAVKQPLELVFEEVYGCDCICGVKPVTIYVRLPASGYCPGQVIPISVEVQNDSSVEITDMIFQLTTRECYRSNEPVAEFMPLDKVLTTVKKGAVMGKTKQSFTCEMIVPDMIVPNLDNCGIIDKAYYFKTTIKLSGCNGDLQDEAEIFLGLIPLKELVKGEYVHPMAYKLPNGPIPNPNNVQNTIGFVEPSNIDPTLTDRPPSYVESTGQIPFTIPHSNIGFNIGQQEPNLIGNPMNAPYTSNKLGTTTGYPQSRNPGAIPSAPPSYS